MKHGPILAASWCALCLFLLTACNGLSQYDVPNPKDVTVSTALRDIGDGFASMSQALEGQVLGVYPCRISLRLNVRASTQTEDKLVLGFSHNVTKDEGQSRILPIEAETRAEHGGSATSEHGNTIEVELYNAGCLPESTLGFARPNEIGEAMQGMGVTRKFTETFTNLVGSATRRSDDKHKAINKQIHILDSAKD